MPEIQIIPNFMLLIIQLVSLLILFFVFKRFGWKPTKAFLEQRKALIAAEFQAVEEVKGEALLLKEQYERQMAQAQEEAIRIIETSREQGHMAYEEIMAQARANAEQKLEKMNIALAVDREAAQEKIQDEIIDMTILGVEKILHKELDAQAHQQLFDDFVRKVGEPDVE